MKDEVVLLFEQRPADPRSSCCALGLKSFLICCLFLSERSATRIQLKICKMISLLPMTTYLFYISSKESLYISFDKHLGPLFSTLFSRLGVSSELNKNTSTEYAAFFRQCPEYVEEEFFTWKTAWLRNLPHIQQQKTCLFLLPKWTITKPHSASPWQRKH